MTSYNRQKMLIKIILLLWAAAFLVGLFAKPKNRGWMAKLFLAGFCLMLLAALIRLLRL